MGPSGGRRHQGVGGVRWSEAWDGGRQVVGGVGRWANKVVAAAQEIDGLQCNIVSGRAVAVIGVVVH